MRFIEDHLGSFSLVELASLKLLDHLTQLSVLVIESLVSLLELANESLEVKAILVSRVFALTDSHQLLDLVHFGVNLFVLTVKELKLLLVVLDCFLSSCMLKVLLDVRERLGTSCTTNDLKSLDLHISQVDPFVQKVDLTVEIIPLSMGLANISLEFSTPVISSLELFRPSLILRRKLLVRATLVPKLRRT